MLQVYVYITCIMNQQRVKLIFMTTEGRSSKNLKLCSFVGFNKKGIKKKKMFQKKEKKKKRKVTFIPLYS